MTQYHGFNVAVVPGWAETKTGIAVITSTFHWCEKGFEKDEPVLSLSLLERLEPGAKPLIDRIEAIYDKLHAMSHCGRPDLSIATVAGREIIAQINGRHTGRNDLWGEQVDILPGSTPDNDMRKFQGVGRIDLLMHLKTALDSQELKVAKQDLLSSLIAEAKKAERRPNKIVLDSTWTPDDGEELPLAVALALYRATRTHPPSVVRKREKVKTTHSPWAY